MDLTDILIPTLTAHRGMSMGAALAECVARDVPGIPFCDDDGHIIGRFSVRHTLVTACLPKDLIKGAHLLGDDILHMDLPDIHAEKVLQMPAERFLFEDAVKLAPASPPIKGLAVMEKYDVTYLFVLDKERYLGVVTHMAVAKLLLTEGCQT